MKHVIAISLVFVSCCISGQSQSCRSGSTRTEEPTRWGGNERIRDIEARPLRTVIGKVQDITGGKILTALIEVYTDPKWDLKNLIAPDAEQERLIGCKVSSGAAFSIGGLKKGTYELRVSIDGGWNVTQVLIRVDPKQGRNKSLVIIPSLGT